MAFSVRPLRADQPWTPMDGALGTWSKMCTTARIGAPQSTLLGRSWANFDLSGVRKKQRCQRPLRQLGFGRVRHQSEMLHGHGPLGGHDPDDGGDHRIHDILDVTEKLDEVMEELLWRLGQHWAAAAAVGARTLLLLELLSLCLLLVWPQGVCRRTACPCLLCPSQ